MNHRVVWARKTAPMAFVNRRPAYDDVFL